MVCDDAAYLITGSFENQYVNYTFLGSRSQSRGLLIEATGYRKIRFGGHVSMHLQRIRAWEANP